MCDVSDTQGYRLLTGLCRAEGVELCQSFYSEQVMDEIKDQSLRSQMDLCSFSITLEQWFSNFILRDPEGFTKFLLGYH